MKMNIISLFILLLSLTFCQKVDFREEPGDCLKQKIAEFQHGDYADSEDATIYRYKFQGHYVYVFDMGVCCDMISPVYNEECVEICGLGGIAGNIMCNGESFDKATDKTLIWENK